MSWVSLVICLTVPRIMFELATKASSSPTFTSVVKWVPAPATVGLAFENVIVPVRGAPVGCLEFTQVGFGGVDEVPSRSEVEQSGGGGGSGGSGGGTIGGWVFVFAGRSTNIAGSPTDHELRKNSSNLQSAQLPIGPTPIRLAYISAPIPPVP